MSPITSLIASLIAMRSSALRFLLGLLAAAVVSGAAIAQNRSGATDSEELQFRLDLLNAELQDIRRRHGGGSPAVSWSGTDSGRLEDEFARITGQIEELQFELRKLREALQLHLEDLTFRIVELEGGDVGELGPISLDGEPSEFEKLVILSERDDLDRAKLDIRQGRFGQGEGLLNRFIAEYPDSSLTGEAHYWLGQSRSVRGDFQQAASNYLAGYNKNPQGEFAPNNLLQLGKTLGQLNQTREACLTLDEVVQKFPFAPEPIRQSVDDEKVALACP